MKWNIAALLGLWIVVIGLCAHAQEAAPDKGKALAFVKISASIPEGKAYINQRMGIFCIPGPPILWNLKRSQALFNNYERVVRGELTRLGYNVVGDPDDPFNQSVSADLEIAATITDGSGDVCSYPTDNKGNGKVKGFLSAEIDWRIYSPSQQRVIKTVHTHGSADVPTFSADGAQRLNTDALLDSLHALVASSEFKAIFAGSGADSTSAAATRTVIALVGSKAAQPMKIPDAVGSVVMVLTKDGMGSAFLISTDGELMTAAHVVGNEKYVKIRWSDGLEGLGEVAGKDDKRDVALIKTDPRGRRPLALALDRPEPQPGDPVYAIGSPLDESFQSTVSRGIVSANRILDGFSFIQSDVNVNHGNSGGPLLNDKGEVLGITDKGHEEKGVAAGINFFVPIGDALLFLKAEPR